jgi:hypothetical protein
LEGRQSACINLGGHLLSEDLLVFGVPMRKRLTGTIAASKNNCQEASSSANEAVPELDMEADDVRNINIIINNNI